MRKCIYCHRNIKEGSRLIVLFDEEIKYLYYFCSWWHVIKWHVRRLICRNYVKGGKQ